MDWLEKNAEGVSWGIMRCERWGKNSASLHAEGRAVDWHLDASRPADRREARRLIDLWLATDSAGNEHALARRMGIQEIIWNCRSWWSGAEGMGNYSACFTERGKRAQERELHGGPQGPHPHRPLMGGRPKAHVLLGALAASPWARGAPRPRVLPPAGGAFAHPAIWRAMKVSAIVPPIVMP